MIINYPSVRRLVGFIVCFCLAGGVVDMHAARKKDGLGDTQRVDVPRVERQEKVPAQILAGDEETKKRDCQLLVDKAIQQIKERTAKEVFEAITWSPAFKKGEIYMFAYDLKGTLFAHGEEPWQLWKNFWNLQDDFGVHIFLALIGTARSNREGAFYTYRWNSALKTSFVRLVEKDGVSYMVGAGYYPYTEQDFVISLVKGAVALFNKNITSDFGKEATFAFLNYRFSNFVFGDFYLKVSDEKGNLLAYGLRPDAVGSNIWDMRDARGILYNQDIIKELVQKPLGQGVWAEYTANNDIKRAYAERVVDGAGKSYFIESGYFPRGEAQMSLVAQEQLVVDLVQKGVRFAQTHTRPEVTRAFSFVAPYKGNPEYTFVRGDFFLFALKLDGTCIAYGLNPEDVGKNLWNVQDDDGRFTIREIITKVKKRKSSWLVFKRRNAFWSVYSQLATIDGKPAIVGCGFYPISKMNTMTLLVKSAIKKIKYSEDSVAFKAITASNGAFVLGDMAIGVVDLAGFCYADGKDASTIWKNVHDVTDEVGKPFMRELIMRAQQGPCMVTARQYGAEKLYYAEAVTKGATTYIVYSGYYPSEEEILAQSTLLHGATAGSLEVSESAKKKYGVAVHEKTVTEKVVLSETKNVAQEISGRKSTSSTSVPIEKKVDVSTPAESTLVGKDGSNGTGFANGDFIAEYQGEVERKRERVKALIEKGVTVFAENSFAQACNKIMTDPALRDGEIFLFVHALDDTVIAYADDARFIWQNMSGYKDKYGSYPTHTLLKQASVGGGWQTYRWNNASKTSYVRLVEKDGKNYWMGAGYYAVSKADEVVALVNSAADVFGRFIKEGLGKEAAFGAFTYPRGAFVYGSLYLYVLDDAGVTVAHGEKVGLTGDATWNVKDPTGKLFVQEIITTLRKKPLGQGMWFNYISKNAPKNVYVQRVVDKAGANYYIVCGYYPESVREKVAEFVARGYRYLKTYGKTAAKNAFMYENVSVDRPEESFVYGDLSLFLFDFSGKVEVIANMPEYTGKNVLNVKDDNGRFIFREIIEKLKKEDSAWLDFRIKNAFWSIYVERVDMGLEPLIIGSGFFPITKLETMHLLVHGAVEFLRTNDEATTFSAFSKRNGNFVRGDLQIFALDASGGTCFTWGYMYDLIWKDLARKADQKGRMYIQALIDATQQEPATLGAQENNAHKVYYAESVLKGDKRYIVGSGYYP